MNLTLTQTKESIMNRIFISLLGSVFLFASVFAEETPLRSTKAVKMQKLERSRLVENQPTLEARGASYWNKPYRHENRNGALSVLVDSSGNGYGLVSSVTRPIDGNDDGNMIMSYRQYCGVGTTHGQLGGAVTEDGEAWDAYFNLNANGNPPWGGGAGVGNGSETTAQARYPSVMASEDYPYVLWNEYTGAQAGGSQYGGRIYWTYGDLGWPSGATGSFTYPAGLDLLWDETKDLWTASPDMFLDENDELAVGVSAADWTRSNNYYFRSDVVEDGYIVMGEEQIVIDEPNCLTAGDASGSFNTPPMISMGDNGFGVMGIIGYFPGADTGVSEISNYHQPIFKVTNDYGLTWSGPDASDPCSFYYLGDDLWADMISSFPSTLVDECGGYEYFIIDFFSYYDFDYKVDANGDIHILMSVIPSDDYYVFFDMAETGWYHFTIDSDYLDNPGQVNTETGWNWSMVASMSDTWAFNANDGASTIWESMATLSFSKDNPDVVWVALNKHNDYACGEIADDFGNDDPCDDTYDYAGTSADIYVYKSMDGGKTWWNPINATDSMDDVNDYPAEWGGVCPTGLLWCGPEEMYVHAPQYSTEDAMMFMYQMPNWGFNEIGDLLGADHMNRVYGAVVEVTSDTEPDPVDCTQSWVAGDVNSDGSINVLDIQSIIVHILGNELEGDPLLAADFNADGNVDVLDILAIVNIILSPRDVTVKATSATLIVNDNNLSMDADGQVGAIELTLSHNEEFSMNLTAKTILDGVAAYNTDGNTTKVVIITPLNGELIQASGSFKVLEAVAANTEGYITSNIIAPSAIEISSAYPNPFNPSTSFNVNVGSAGDVSIMVYNVNGQVVDMIHEGPMNAGVYSMTWNASDLSSGMYIIKANNADVTVSQKVMLIK